MTRSPRLALPALALVTASAVAAASAGAQQQQALCQIDQNKPSSLGAALFTVQRVQSLPDTTAKHKAIREAALKIAQDGNAVKQNANGTALTLTQLWGVLAQDAHTANNATRGGIGLTGDAAARVDLLATIDSTASIVERVSPACKELGGQLRQMAWMATMNAGLQALNANKYDSAGFYANRSLVVYKESPLAYYALSLVAQNAKDMAAAEGHWQRMVETTASDTSAQGRELRTNAMYNLAVTAAQKADAATGDQQKQLATGAADRIKGFLAAYPQYPDAQRLQTTLARMLTLTGDKSAIASVYADQLANPAKYDDLALTNAGVIASQAGQQEDAARLFAAALEKSPYQRDALNNLSATNMNLKRWEPMLAPTRRLIEVDPGNPDNYLLMAVAYQGLANAAKAPAQKKAYTDSLVKYNNLSQNLPHKVTFTEFTRGTNRVVLGLNVETVRQQGGATRPAARAGAAARPAAGAAKSYTIRVDFLDAQGAVVDTQTTQVGPVAPGETKPARIESAKSGVVAFRYTVGN